MPTAGVSEYGLGVTLRLLPTAGVCDWHIGGPLRQLLTAGVGSLAIGLLHRLLPTVGACNKDLGRSLRHMPTTGPWDQPFGESLRHLCNQFLTHQLDICPLQVNANIKYCVTRHFCTTGVGYQALCAITPKVKSLKASQWLI